MFGSTLLLQRELLWFQDNELMLEVLKTQQAIQLQYTYDWFADMVAAARPVTKFRLFPIHAWRGLVDGLSNDKYILSCEIRLNIVIGVTETSEYFNKECLRPVIHRDVKSPNIILFDESESQVRAYIQRGIGNEFYKCDYLRLWIAYTEWKKKAALLLMAICNKVVFRVFWVTNDAQTENVQSCNIDAKGDTSTITPGSSIELKGNSFNTVTTSMEVRAFYCENETLSGARDKSESFHVYIEKEDNKKLKQKQREGMQPKMGKTDIDYHVWLLKFVGELKHEFYQKPEKVVATIFAKGYQLILCLSIMGSKLFIHLSASVVGKRHMRLQLRNQVMVLRADKVTCAEDQWKTAPFIEMIRGGELIQLRGGKDPFTRFRFLLGDTFRNDLGSTSGHVALPGGRTDEVNTDDSRTALQEAKEEIGLDSASVDVVTVLKPFVNKVTQVEIGMLKKVQQFLKSNSKRDKTIVEGKNVEIFQCVFGFKSYEGIKLADEIGFIVIIKHKIVKMKNQIHPDKRIVWTWLYSRFRFSL
ncbi:nudix hydrolase [Artemisia annua]|uniref:Nudix hydrolase n=1 Tax=Artemisia annua TaxID=35608 RepID=A0A2U1KVS4_ARTAN|nr:nudix hydrolase [Artemisia annua]